MALSLNRDDGSTYHVITFQQDWHLAGRAAVNVASYSDQVARLSMAAEPYRLLTYTSEGAPDVPPEELPVTTIFASGVPAKGSRSDVYAWLKAQPEWSGATDV